jgi:hypothetical protein
MMRTLIAFTLLALSLPQGPSDVTPFLVRWNVTDTCENSGLVYWLQVAEDGGPAEGDS